MGRVLGVVLAFIALLALAAVVLVAGAQPAAVAALPSVSPNASAANAFDQKVAAFASQLAQEQKTGAKTPLSITFTEQELTSKAAQVAAADPTSPLQPKGIQVHLRSPNLIVSATVSLQGFSVPLTVTATPQVVGGKMQLAVQRVDTGGLALPDFVRQEIAAQVGSLLDPARLGLPVNVLAVQVGDGTITVEVAPQ